MPDQPAKNQPSGPQQQGTPAAVPAESPRAPGETPARRGPRPLPGEDRSPVTRAAGAVAGVVAIAVLIVAMALVRPSLIADHAAGTGSSGSAAGQSSGGVTPTGETTAVTVTVSGMAFEPSVIEVPLGNELVVTLDNTGDQRHDLVFSNGVALAAVPPGSTGTVDVGMITATLDGWCSITGHRQMGMALTVVATGTGAATGSGDDTGAAAGHDHSSDATAQTSAAPTAADLEQYAATVPAHPAELAPLDDATEHSYTFTITETQEGVTDGMSRTVWTYNGTAPGPTLHGRVGDTFEIRLVNNGSMGHSIDFHAGEIAPNEPMRTIEPGEELVYRFTANRSGIWLYHCSTMPMATHIASGMFGAVIIEPDGLEAADQQYVLIQSELYYGADGEPADADKVAAMSPDAWAFNGRPFQYLASPLTARTGERVRIWVLDAGPNDSLAFHVVGTQFDTVWREGAYSVYRGTSADGITAGVTGAQVLSLDAAEGGFVELVATEPGDYTFVNHRLSIAQQGARGVLRVTS